LKDADTWCVQTQLMDETGVDSIDIDEQFGWEQAARAKVQQLRYAGRRSRSSRCKVTMMI
jgi:hypothetical protein